MDGTDASAPLRAARIAEGVPGCMFVADADGALLFLKAAPQGFPPGRKWHDCIHPDDRARAVALFAAASASGAPARADLRLLPPEGEPRPFACRLAPVRIDARTTWWLGIGREPDCAEPSGRGAPPAALAALVRAQAKIADAAGDASATLDIVMHAALAVVGAADGAAIEMMEGDELVYRAASGTIALALGVRLAPASSLSGRCIREAAPLLSEDCDDDPRVDRAAVRAFAVRSMVVVPVFRGARPVGVLKVVSAWPRAFSQTDVLLAQLLVGTLDLGIADAAERAARHDRDLSAAARDASQAQFGAFAEALPGLMFVSAPDGGNVHVNRAYCDFTGRSAQDLMGQGWRDALHPEDARAGLRIWEAARDSGGLYEAEYRFRRHDGEWRWHLVRALPVRGEDGAIAQWVGCCVDIHERRMGEEALQRRIAEALAERRFWADIVDASDAFIQAVSPDLRVLAANPANVAEYQRRHGVRMRPGDRLADLFREKPALLEGMTALWRRALAGEHFSEALSWTDDARGVQYYDNKYGPLYGPDGKLVGALRFAYDVTERLRESEALAQRTEELHCAHRRLQAEMKRREEAQAALVQAQKLEALGQLTSGIAHDFNNVTQAVAGGFEVIGRRTGDPRIAEIARHGAAAAERGGRLVKQLLAFARQQVLAPQPVDLEAQLRETLPLLRRTVGEKVEVAVVCPPGLPPARIDPAWLETALINLAANAADAMPQGGALQIRVRESAPGEPGRPAELEARRALAIAVADNGTGMSASVRERALEPFFTTKGPGRGTGLGLAMVHGFVRQSSGALTLESVEGEGATVTLYLPRDETPAPPPSPAAAVVEAAPLSILLVDDDGEVRDVTAALLADLGHRVTTAGGAEAALAAFSAARFDLVVSDVVMPGRDGPELAQDLRRLRPDQPILFVTGHADRARLRGEHVLDKPFSVSTLAEALRLAAG